MATTASMVGMTRAALLLPAFSVSDAWACFDCRKAVEAQVYGPDFTLNLLALLLPLGTLAVLGAAAFHWDRFSSKRRKDQQDER